MHPIVAGDREGEPSLTVDVRSVLQNTVGALAARA